MNDVDAPAALRQHELHLRYAALAWEASQAVPSTRLDLFLELRALATWHDDQAAHWWTVRTAALAQPECAYCATPLPAPRSGRPRIYCRDACRSAAAYARRRLT